ncbi:MAG: lysine exporter LysO family protein [Zestosphaera sp.]
MLKKLESSRLALLFAAGLITGLATNLRVGEEILWTTLLCLIFAVGLSMGLEINKIASMSREKISWGLKLILATLTGSLTGGAVIYLLIGEPALKYSLAISAGMGWYSFTGTYLASIDPYLGFLGYLSNILREVYTYITYPLLAKKLRYSSISLGGATTMDTTLPVIASVGGSEAGVIAFIHGAFLTLLIPIIVSALAST